MAGSFASKDGKRVKLYSRPGNDLTHRFPLITEALARLRSRSCIIAGFRQRRHDEGVFLYAFDLIELDGEEPAARTRSRCARRRSRACSRARRRGFASTHLEARGRRARVRARLEARAGRHRVEA
jgi:hypothetical protein